ncbi:SIMPL domain-containing protein [Thalassotalea aquiviva]|uniref:SIMPL domain-containing protein n=1 Tax=Thalassotalea aquiviva TaxID=3242415 RepID=UPI003529F3CC
MIRFLFFVGALLCGSNVMANALPEFPFITVSGQAEIKVKPDKATLNFVVTSIEAESEAALDNVNNTANKILFMLLKQGVNDKDIKSFSIAKQARRSQNLTYDQITIQGYEVTQRFEVSLQRLDNFPQIIDFLLNRDHVERLNTEFDLKDRQQLEYELIKQAGNNARINADNIAAAVGAKVDAVYGISQDRTFADFFASFGFDKNNFTALMSNEGGPNKGVFVPEHITLKTQVHVVYKLAQ